MNISEPKIKKRSLNFVGTAFAILAINQIQKVAAYELPKYRCNVRGAGTIVVSDN